MSIVYFNDSFVAFDQAKIPISDKGFLYGTGVFTTILVLDGKIFFLKEHLKRLKRNCLALHIEKRHIDIGVLIELLRKNDALKGRWRLKILLTAKDQEQVLLITLQKQDPYTKKDLSLCLYPQPVFSPIAKIKTLAFLSRFTLLKYAEKRNFDDCITVDENQHILEAAIANVFWIRENTLFYPHHRLPYLKGITLSFAILLAKKMKMLIKGGRYKIEELKDARLFYCNSIKQIICVKKLEGIELAPHLRDSKEFIHLFHMMAERYAL